MSVDETRLTYYVTTVTGSLSLPPYLEDVATVTIDDFSVYMGFFVTVPKSWGAVLESYFNDSSDVVKYQLDTSTKRNAYLLCYHPESPNELYYITYLGDTLPNYVKRVIFYIHTSGYKFVTKPMPMSPTDIQRPFIVPENIRKTFSESQALPPSFFLY